MTYGSPIKQAALAACSSLAVALSGCATAPAKLADRETLTLGRNAAGDPCVANRTFQDEALKGLFNASFTITCRNVSASRAAGYVRVFRDAAPESLAAVEGTLSCGAAAPAVLPGVGPVQARRCVDSSLGSEAAVITASHRGMTIIGSAARNASGPLEKAIQTLAGNTPAAADAVIDFAALAKPESAATQIAGRDFDASLALQQGIALNNQGLHVEASRLLNDALSRLGAGASTADRAELSLEAGLADSNIRFTQAADEHFARADQLINEGAGKERLLLLRKRDTYRALDLLNRRQFRRALAALDELVSARSTSQPLTDIAVLRAINQPARETQDLAASVAVPQVEVLQQLEIDAQAQWAKSIALNAMGDITGAQAALDAADAAFEPLSNERIKRGPVHWLKAKLERQRGRLEARRGHWPQAIASFDRAIEAMTRGSVESGGNGAEPGVAEMRLERATIVAEQGGPAAGVSAAYSEAVDALIAAGASSSVTPRGMETYLNLLVQANSPENSERFFRAIQAIGEPAVARQMSRIQAVVTADPAVGSKVRDKAELEREITRLRYEIADTDAKETARIAALEGARRQAQERLTTLETELAGDSRLNSADDRPASVADIRAALRPGESFLKITQLRSNAYGILISPEETLIYKLDAPAKTLAQLSNRIRESIDGRLDEGKLVPFDVAASYALFRLISGPAMNRLLQSTSVILDPAGPLERLPAGVLVTDRESVDRYDAAAKSKKFDFSGVNFLAARASVSTAVSPRSFLVARSLPQSRATMPFIGFAEHEAPQASADANGKVAVGNVCFVESSALRELAAAMDPISREEIEIAARALGAESTPLVAGQAFTDTAVEAMSNLNNYKVLHFATHGLEEGVWGCPKSPPALVTSFGDSDSDGLLSFDEIAGLRLDANLVVLSACDTGAGIRSEELARRSGQEESGSTLQGLVRAFLTANARAVMATHWEVPAKDGTRELIETFYTTANTRDIGTSLQTAQRQLIATPAYSHPFYWGAYFVVGDSSKSVLGKPAQVAAR